MKKLVLIISMLFMSIFSVSLANAQTAGKILFVYGKAEIQRDAKTTQAKRGSVIEAGDIVKTAKASTAQIKLNDGTLVALRPNTVWNLQEFVYNQKNPGLGKQSSELIKGGLRAVTGLIGKADPKKIKYAAGTTTIGIRGTTFEMANITSGKDAGVYVRVETGKVNVMNKLGNIDVFPNEMVKSSNNIAPVEVQNTEVFVNVDQQIAKEASQPLGGGAKAPSEQNRSENSQMIVSATSKILATENQPTQADKIAKEVTNTNTEVVAIKTDKLEEALEYHKLALEIKGLGLSFPTTTSASSGNNEKQMQINKKTQDFINSTGEFVGKGYKELKTAYDKLPNADKELLKNQPQDLNPLKFFDEGMSYSKSKVEISGGKLVFSKLNDTTTTPKSSFNGTNPYAYISKGTNTFTLPNETYTYKIEAHNSYTELKTNKTTSVATGADLEIYVDFANKKFVNSKDTKLNYIFNVSGNKYKFKNSGVAPESYIHDSGAFYLSFQNLTVTEKMGSNPETSLSFFSGEDKKVGEIVGNFYDYNGSIANRAVGVYGLVLEDLNDFQIKDFKVVGHLDLEMR